MEAQERKDLFDSLWPVGKERWFKVLIVDQEKCMKNLPWVEDTERLGFEVKSITVRDEFQPQVSALMDVKDDVVSLLSRYIETARFVDDTNTANTLNGINDIIRDIFKSKITEVNNRTIKTITKETI